MKKAFTLAEVLITLGIIGVVAALTIPGLMQSYKAIRLRSQFLKSYSIIQQTFKLMDADGESLDMSSYATRTFYKIFINYLQGAYDCGDNTTGNRKHILPCYAFSDGGYGGVVNAEPYKTLDGKSEVNGIWFDDGQIVLQDGTLILFENDTARNHLWISVDVNGYNTPPNRWGYDLFTFQMLNEEIRPMGSEGTAYSDTDKYCNLKGSGTMNGIACAELAKSDTDYFKKLVKQVK